MAFRPLHDRVAVRRLESEENTKGGTIIPDTAKEKPQEGEIIAAGPVEAGMKPANLRRSMSRRATRCCLANGRAPRSRSTVRISLS